MAPFTQQFIIDGQWLGEAERGLDKLHDVVGAPRSLAFCCPHCAEVWARCPVALARNSNGSCQPFQIVTKACKKCPTDDSHGRGISGSLYLPWDMEFTEAFPLEVERRELLLHLSLYPE